ncbi:kynureninase [Microbacterium excoecariae]|uniref:kynureninase n=1 Tax=Microbacterium excoecariae TaxID=2715210 RepID=UPI00140B2D9D|nr:kynureninase [Microbacterium excoecariae]NHI15998.1 kynureninase [Microbacterium excoecariae]
MTTAPTSAPVAAELDAADPLRAYRAEFVAADDPSVRAYLDGNSLGRPPAALRDRMSEFVARDWGTDLIRGWGTGWFDKPLTLGDRIGAALIGAAPGQTIVGESTTVSLYKVVRAAVAARPDRSEIVVDRGNFPSDRYLVEGIAAETGRTLVWIDPDPESGVTPDQVASAVGERTAAVILSHVAYRSAYIADMAAITRVVHEAGALVVWDLCHSVGAVPIELDALGVDFAAGCTYKYVGGGPGSPAFLYVAKRHLDDATQPIQGWMGVRDSFAMGQGYEPADGIRRFISGTPPILGMVPMESMLDLIERAGIEAIREKSIALTEFAIALADELLAPHGVTLSSPRDPAVRGGHVTIDHPAFAGMMDDLWHRGVIPDFRPPSGIRLGLSPLSTSFTEVDDAIRTIAMMLEERS